MANHIVVDGYAFSNKMDAELAETEGKKVEYLRKHLDQGNPDTILALYNKAVKERLFKTPVGTDFLKELQVYLIESADVPVSEVEPIPMFQNYSGEIAVYGKNARQRIANAPTPKEKIPLLTLSIIFNIVLVAAVIAMYVITLKADQPNIINYETNLLNKYSYWEQELTDREAVIRETEKKLGIEK